MDPDPEDRARILIACADRPGIVAAVSTFLAAQGANIVESDQHSTDPADGHFYMRMEFRLDGLDARLDALRDAFAAEVGDPLGMDWHVTPVAERRRVVLLASREPHCLLDLLWRWRSGELPADVVSVISNHPDHRDIVATFGLPYHHVPDASETEILRLIEGQADLAVLARYMRILSADLLERAGMPFINIHHSFLPAFVGANPYGQAFERGVKVIGATAHYVTPDLDAGPIIEQDVAHVTHRQQVADLARAGADLERVVLSRAVRAHLEDRVIVGDGRTVVF